METPSPYHPRTIDALLENHLAMIGAVLIEGPKWCGKTWTGMTHAQSALWVADPQNNYLTRTIATADPASLLTGDKPILIDEWRDAPGLWDAARVSIDRTPGPNQYILTGSATPRDTVTSHSGTGRIARLEMWPMSLWESGISTGKVSVAQLLTGAAPEVVKGPSSESELMEAAVIGGWPGTLDQSLPNAAGMARIYLDSVAYSDASRLDGTRRDPNRLKALLSAVARTTASLVSNTTLAKDMSVDGTTVAPRTMADYLDILSRLHVVKEIPSWAPALRSPLRLRRAPKRLMVDPSLAVAGIHATIDTLATDRKTYGFIFETMCLRDLAIYASSVRASLYHYHDDAGLEADAILQCDDGRWAGVEIKASASREDEAAIALLRLRDKMTARGERPPAALIVLVGAGSYSHRREDGIDVIPIDLLRP